MKTRVLQGKLILNANLDRVRLETEKWIYDLSEIVPPILDKDVIIKINETGATIMVSTK